MRSNLKVHAAKADNGEKKNDIFKHCICHRFPGQTTIGQPNAIDFPIAVTAVVAGKNLNVFRMYIQ